MSLPKHLTPNQEAIASQLKEHGPLSVNALKAKTGLSFSAVNSVLLYFSSIGAIAATETDSSVLYELKQQPSLS